MFGNSAVEDPLQWTQSLQYWLAVYPRGTLGKQIGGDREPTTPRQKYGLGLVPGNSSPERNDQKTPC